MARFFIDRPIFAWVIAILVMLAGALSITRLPVSMYPDIAPPAVSISASYPGASAEAVENAVTQVIEQSMKGLDGLIYMSATSSASGQAYISLTFQSGTDPDIAQVQVQNKLQLAMPLLPQEVQRQGVNVTKSRTGFLMIVGLVSKDGRMNREDIADFVGSNLRDPLSRVEGVGTVQPFGSPYAMRIWLDPNKLDTYGLSVADITAAVRAQNAQVTVGQLGGTPAVEGQRLNATISAQSRLRTPEQFRQIVVRSHADGSALRLGEVARVELGAESYDAISRFNGQSAVGMAISLATGANALATAAAVRARLEELRPFFPAGLDVVVPFDTTPFVQQAIHEVVKTLALAVLLVFLVIFVFLRNFRATLIPTIAVPVVLLGTFGVLAALGFSINVLTMFAMVLAIGLLVDDAIVVVENVERLMHEEGLSPLEATRKSMDQITGALVAIGVVLAAVFVPMAFMTGSVGVIYRQFSATIVAAMALSVFVAIVLTPALCATLLKPATGHAPHAPGSLFGTADRAFKGGLRRYETAVRRVLARSARFMLVYLGLAVVMLFVFQRLPSAFLPEEDQGFLVTVLAAPPGSTQQRTLESVLKVEDHFLRHEPAIKSVFTIVGFSFAGSGQNAGQAFVHLKPWDERKSPDQHVGAVAQRAMGAFAKIRDAMAFAFAPPAVPELGVATGFTFFLKDNAGHGHVALVQARNQLLGMVAKSRLLANVRPNGQEDTPQFKLDVDTAKAAALGVAIADINATLSAAWGGNYIDDFIDRGRVKRVYVQADAPFRMKPDDFRLWSVRNAAGRMVPVSSFATWHWEFGSPRLERYNGVSAVEIQGEAAPGVSTGQAMREVEQLVARLPAGFGIEWTGASYQERQAGAQTPLLYALSLAVVFLCLAALYESWSIPTAVLMVAPLGILGAALATALFDLQRDVYFQVAMLTTVGLTSKNAILIIEFAKANYERGMDLVEATMTAVKIRLRPILMTSLAFGFGVLPLAIASGAGSGAQRAIGTGVLGGMIVGTGLGIFFIPLFFVVVERWLVRHAPAGGRVAGASPALDGGDAHG
jgi:multidrug efflux pump